MRNVLTWMLGALLLAACLAPNAPESPPTGADADATPAIAPPIADLLDRPVPTAAGVPRPAPPLPRIGTPRATQDATTETDSETDGGTDEETGVPQQAQVQVALSALRAAPDDQGTILGYVIQGDMLQVMGASADGRWLRVCCPIDADGPVWIEAATVRIAAGGRAARTVTPSVATQVVLTVTATPSATQTPAESVTGIVNAARVNLRGGPGTNYATVGQVREETLLEIVGRNETGSWLRVCCPVGEDAESWISAEFVDLAPHSVLAAVPIAAAPPTPEAPVGGGGGGGGAQSAAALAAAPAAGLPGPGGFGAPGSTNPLTGLPLPGGRTGQRPVIVCINNDYAARPQFGISQADVMYEYLMEGYGITRFSGVFYGEDVGQIGPVRSARLINYYMGALYNAGLVCSGASDPVRYMLKHQAPFPYMDIDLDDASNTRYSVSIGRDYRTRLRTETGKLHRWLSDWGVQEPASIRGFTFGGAPGPGGLPGVLATSITIPYPSGTGSNSAYVYDGGSGRYLRSMGGGAHVDGNSGAQVGVENVIVQYVPHEATDIVEDSLGSTSIRLDLFGSGRAIVFRDGQAFEGTWRSESRGDTPRFYDSGGSEIPLKPGKTWISVVPSNYTVSYR